VWLDFPFAYLFLFYCCTQYFRQAKPSRTIRKKISDAGLKETAIGAQWFAAAERALRQPVSVTLPYKEVGYFGAETPKAVGLNFAAQRGEKLTIQLTKRSSGAFMVYGDLWKAAPTPLLKASFDTTSQPIVFEVKETGDYILRLQPELLSSGEYTVSIVAGPLLGFPVANKNARIGSIWGDARDAGARRHEGIDIFAPKRTPAVAAADGVVTTVNENNLGGKVVWLRPHQADYILYYAHLDKQLVGVQQQVQSGDTLGLVGNTGNARTTPPHLHFGIYAFGGAINPLPFINRATKQPANVTAELFKNPIRLTASAAIIPIENSKTNYKAHTIALPVAVNATAYRVEFPDGIAGSVPVNGVQSAIPPLRYIKVRDTAALLEQPQSDAIQKMNVMPASRIGLLGYFNNYAFVQTERGVQGWVFENVLK
jgi:murein DD-endopeptidase MepM/ murein hydrolase activator NlpD